MFNRIFLTPFLLVCLAGCDNQVRSNTAAGSAETSTRKSSSRAESKPANFKNGGPSASSVTNNVIKVREF